MKLDYIPTQFQNKQYKQVQTNDPVTMKKTTKPEFADVGVCGASFFIVSMMLFLISASLALLYTPQLKRQAAGVEIPDDAFCYIIERYTDYIAVNLVLGTPPQKIKALLILDSVVTESESSMAQVRVLTNDALHSSTVVCDHITKRCTDQTIVSVGIQESTLRAQMQYDYVDISDAAYQQSIVHSLPGIGAEMWLISSSSYWITDTHLCVRSGAVQLDKRYDYDPNHALEARWNDYVHHIDDPHRRVATMYAPLPSIQHISGFVSTIGTSPLVTIQHACSSEDALVRVNMMPSLATQEDRWLSIGSQNNYDSGHYTLAIRRSVAEIGTRCASNISTLKEDLSIYLMDCSPTSSCILNSSLPFRRVFTSSIFIRTGDVHNESDTTTFVFKEEKSLLQIPGVPSESDAFVWAVLKLLMIVLTTAVMFLRSKRSTSNPSWILFNTLKIARDAIEYERSAPFDQQCPKKEITIRTPFNKITKIVMEDFIVAVLTLCSRIAIISWRMDVLWADGHARTCVLEVVALCMSAVHVFVRYIVIEIGTSEGSELPITKLGGSTAIVDSTSAVIVAFSEPPIMTMTIGRFDPSARLLMSLLISLVVMIRCSISCTCCGLLWSIERYCPSRRIYASMLLASGIMWAFQLSVLGIKMCDLFVVPFTYTITETSTGTVVAVRLVVFFGVICAGIPRLTNTFTSIIFEDSKSE